MEPDLYLLCVLLLQIQPNPILPKASQMQPSALEVVSISWLVSKDHACSAGKLNFVAASGYTDKVWNGVLNLALSSSVKKIYTPTLEISFKIAVKDTLGIDDLDNTSSNIMFCMPSKQAVPESEQTVQNCG